MSALASFWTWLTVSDPKAKIAAAQAAADKLVADAKAALDAAQAKAATTVATAQAAAAPPPLPIPDQQLAVLKSIDASLKAILADYAALAAAPAAPPATHS